MADPSKVVLRWEIDNATARFETGKVESEVFTEGGFKWNIVLDRNDEDGAGDFTLTCGSDSNGWKCKVKMVMCLLRSDGTFCRFSSKGPFMFEANNCEWLQESKFKWSGITLPRYLINGKSTFEIRIKIISSERGQPIAASKFAAPSRMSNVILKIGEERLHVSKEFLAVHSPVFETMFFGNFAANGKEEVEIKDVVYEEFVDLLHLIYPRISNISGSNITDRTVLHILKLADQFQIENLLEESKIHLTQSKGFDVLKKLQIADQYNLIPLRDHCLRSFASVAELKEKLTSSPDHDNFSAEMKIAIYERIMKI